MATLLLSAAGAALGGSLGGSFAGLATGVLGKAVGASLGAAIDQKLTGLGSEPVEAGRVERFRVMGAAEGTPIPRVFGRVRVAGQVIWSSRFLEDVETSQVGGKGTGGRGAEVREFSYSISLALALCQGEVYRIGRIWADGQKLDVSSLAWRLHDGSEDQIPDPLIAAIEGEDEAPAYRGTAYVVFENLPLGQFGNRIPQFNFEVFRRPDTTNPTVAKDPALQIQAVALIPGTGEYSLATVPVSQRFDKVRSVLTNVNNDRGRPDLLVSLEQKRAELPNARSTSLVVSWFGNDLRCDRCTLQPKVEQKKVDGAEMPWRVSGVDRGQAALVGDLDGRPVFGGTPADAAVVQAIRHMREAGERVMFYPFILMDILGGNGLPNPWTGAAEQPRVPWRGRITTSISPGRPGSPDGRSAASQEVDLFFGAATVGHFSITGGEVGYSGPTDWGYRRFILHYAHLCKAAGGVDAFCIGSEMRSLTQIRDGKSSYPAVRLLRELARDVRTVLGPNTKIGYAADWSEYFGHHAQDGSGDVHYHLDPLWSDSAIDFVGIDNYMPLTDWRDGLDHADAHFLSKYNREYVSSGVMGGEGYDWFYASSRDRDEQLRTPITDGAFGEPWVFRYKDLVNWWSRAHHDRPNGVRSATPTTWIPESKPIWFTEVGCPAVDKGTNQPNVFVDPKSSESFLPYYSSGMPDPHVQKVYLNAIYSFWSDGRNNPSSSRYSGRMLDVSSIFVWAWDARPWPDFPDRLETWTDGENYSLGHWVNTRIAMPSVSAICGEILETAACRSADLAGVHGSISGYSIAGTESVRQSLQPLMLSCALILERGESVIRLLSAGAGQILSLSEADLADGDEAFDLRRDNAQDGIGEICIDYLGGTQEYLPARASFRAPGATSLAVSTSSLPMVLSEVEALAIAHRWYGEADVAKDTLVFTLPPSRQEIRIGSLVSFGAALDGRAFRVDKIDDSDVRKCQAVRLEPSVYNDAFVVSRRNSMKTAAEAAPVYAEVLDLPLVLDDEAAAGPVVAVGQEPWRGDVAVYARQSGAAVGAASIVRRPSMFGEFLSPVPSSVPSVPIKRDFIVKLSTPSHVEALMRRDPATSPIVVSWPDIAHCEILTWRTVEPLGGNLVAFQSVVRGEYGTEVTTGRAIGAGTELVVPVISNGRIPLSQQDSAGAVEFLVGPARKAYTDQSYTQASGFSAASSRPYAPCQARVRLVEGPRLVASWLRRSRAPVDSWGSLDPVLLEDSEIYSVRLILNQEVVSAFEIAEPRFSVSLSELGWRDGMPLSIEVCQIGSTGERGSVLRIPFEPRRP